MVDGLSFGIARNRHRRSVMKNKRCGQSVVVTQHVIDFESTVRHFVKLMALTLTMAGPCVSSAQTAERLQVLLDESRKTILAGRAQGTIVVGSYRSPWAYAGRKVLSHVFGQTAVWDGDRAFVRTEPRNGEKSAEITLSKDFLSYDFDPNDPLILAYEIWMPALGRTGMHPVWIADVMHERNPEVQSKSGYIWLRWEVSQADRRVKIEVALDPAHSLMIRKERCRVTDSGAAISRGSMTEFTVMKVGMVGQVWLPIQTSFSRVNSQPGRVDDRNQWTTVLANPTAVVPDSLFSISMSPGDIVRDGKSTWQMSKSGKLEPWEGLPDDDPSVIGSTFLVRCGFAAGTFLVVAAAIVFMRRKVGAQPKDSFSSR